MLVSKAPQERHCSVCLCCHLYAQCRSGTQHCNLQVGVSEPLQDWRQQKQFWKANTPLHNNKNETTLHVQPSPHKTNLAGDSIGYCMIKINFLNDFCFL